MSGLFGLSIDPQTYEGNFLHDIFWGTFYQQHLGEEYAGLSTSDGKQIRTRTHRGLFRPTFSEDMGGLEGTEGIGYCGSSREPFLTDSQLGEISACFSGNIINLSDLTERFKSFRHSFARDGDDVEIFTKLIAQGNDIPDDLFFSLSNISLSFYHL
jgi:amidophosphoribosyltransferase